MDINLKYFWNSIEVVLTQFRSCHGIVLFCELSLSTKCLVCSTLPLFGWPSLGRWVAILEPQMTIHGSYHLKLEFVS